MADPDFPRRRYRGAAALDIERDFHAYLSYGRNPGWRSFSQDCKPIEALCAFHELLAGMFICEGLGNPAGLICFQTPMLRIVDT